MPHPVTGIDHTYLLVDDLDRAVVDFSLLGFTVSPRGFHSAEKGTANHTIMFERDYVELLGVVAQTRESILLKENLKEQGAGIRAIVGQIGDARQAAAELAGLEIETTAISEFQRPVSLPDGREGSAAFSTVAFSAREIPFGTLFMCQHHNRENVWLPELLRHQNSAEGLGAIIGVSEHPEEDARRFARLWRDGAVRRDGDIVHVLTGAGSCPIALTGAQQFKSMYPTLDIPDPWLPSFVALQIVVSSLETATRIISEAGIRIVATETGIAVDPIRAGGAVLEFVEK